MRGLLLNGAHGVSAAFAAFCLIVGLAFASLCLAQQDEKALKREASESSVGTQARVGDLYALVVGISQYGNPRVPKLKVSDKDARDIAAFLKTQTKLFRNVHVTLLTNEQATRSEVEKELIYKLRRAGKDDTVVVFLSGHGADDPNTPGEFFFLTYDADPNYLAASALHMNRQWWIRKLDARRVVLIADSCHAGGFSVEGAKSFAPSLERFMQQFKESEGRVFLTSSRSDEVSREKPDRGNSVFTYYLLEGLNGAADRDADQIVSLRELYDYVYEKTKAETNGFQSPRMEGHLVGAFPLALAGLRPSEPARVPETSGPAATKPSRPPHTPEQIRSLRERAGRGDAVAQNNLGLCYSTGDGVTKDYQEAARLFHLAADTGVVVAQYNLALAYRDGEGVAKDYGEAVRWFHKAADQGHPASQNQMGLRYYHGQGVPKDNKEAARW